MSACAACAPGTAALNVNTTRCTPCEPGYKQAGEGAQQCTPCGEKLDSGTGATECTFCKKGYFTQKEGPVSNDNPCILCSDLAVQSTNSSVCAANSTIRTVQLVFGRWRLTEQALSLIHI